MKKFLIPIFIILGIALIGGIMYFTIPKVNKNKAPKILPTGQVKEFNVELFNFGFNPEVIEVNAGDTVRLNVTTKDISHGIGINEYMINKRVDPGQTVVVEFVANKKGEFRIYCTIPCGEGHLTMEARLIVK